jgi:hypothetical protein
LRKNLLKGVTKMMKPSARSQFLFAAAAFVVSISFASPGDSQTVSQELSDAAQVACRDSAVAKGFEVVSVASVEPKSGTTDGATVVLNLTRNGEPFKLTCGYTPAAAAAPATTSPEAIASPSPVATPTPTATTSTPVATETRGFPWWWLLLPLIGIPLLYWLLRKPAEETTVIRTTEAKSYAPPTPTLQPERPAKTTPDYRNYVTPAKAVIRSNNHSVNVFSGPATSYRVTGVLQDGQEVMLSGHSENNWSELTEGGWVPSSNLELV